MSDYNNIPAMTYSIDGNQVMCTGPGFRNLAEDCAGFGNSLRDAFLDLIRQEPLASDCNLANWERKFLDDNPSGSWQQKVTDLEGEVEAYANTMESLTEAMGGLEAENQALQQRVAELEGKTCVWKPGVDYDYEEDWETGCGGAWYFPEGGIKENGMNYCPHCGGKVTNEQADE